MDDWAAFHGNEHYGVIVDFLRGQRPDWEGRWLADIRDWDAHRLEEDHHYIQWLFPLTIESEAVFAPVVRQHEVTQLREDIQLQGQMLSFYGFEIHIVEDEPMVMHSGRHEERIPVWMTPGNHNYRRISCILGSLTLLGLKIYAQAFHSALESLYQTIAGAQAIDAEAIWYWQRSAQRLN